MADAATGAEATPTADASNQAKPPTVESATGDAGMPGFMAAGMPHFTDENMQALFQNLAKQLPALVQQLPPGVRHLIPNAELDVAATLAANAAANAPCAA